LQAKKRTRSRERSNQPETVAKLLNFIQTNLDDNKAVDPATIDLAGKSSIADYLVIASGTSVRHVAAMADHLTRGLRKENLANPRTEGLPQADWVLIDAGDIIVHIFRPEVRGFYDLEKMWSVDFETLAT
jgi:ribosome-associated protein